MDSLLSLPLIQLNIVEGSAQILMLDVSLCKDKGYQESQCGREEIEKTRGKKPPSAMKLNAERNSIVLALHLQNAFGIIIMWYCRT